MKIGYFTRASSGGYSGSIVALGCVLRGVVIETMVQDGNRPDYRILVEGCEIGCAWNKTDRWIGPYLAVRLHGPFLSHDIEASLIGPVSFNGFDLVWHGEEVEP